MLNRVRCALIQKVPSYFDRILAGFLPLYGSIFLICDTLLLIHTKKRQQSDLFFNMNFRYA